MRAKAAKEGTTLRAIAGTYNVLLALDLEENRRPGCLGFSIERTDLQTGERRWLPNMVGFGTDDKPHRTSARAPLQSFRWGDYAATPGQRYRYRAVPRYGSADEVLRTGLAAEAPGAGDSLSGGVSVEIRTEDPKSRETAVFFNRGAAASKAYVERFGNTDPGNNPVAMVWLSRGLEEALLAYMMQAKDARFGLHACIYEFQKENLLDALGAAKHRGVDVQVVYHARKKAAADHKSDHEERLEHGATEEESKVADDDDDTEGKNVAAIRAAGLDKLLKGHLTPRKANPQGGIMHDKYVVLLEDGKPSAVWTGSTNWTEGALYGQLNVGHAIYDPQVASQYERSFQLLQGDPDAAHSKSANRTIAAVPASRDQIPHGVSVVFSPQKDLAMIDLYAEVCAKARLLFVSAPFLLHSKIRDVLNAPSNGALRYVMADKAGALGPRGAIDLFNGDPGRVGAAATLLRTKLNDFQGRLLEGPESFHHRGVHIHSKIILADPFGTDPILITGSANFSNGSTTLNDSNSLIVRGNTDVIDIYATEFMRMFQHYWFRFKESAAGGDETISLKDTDIWQQPFYDPADTHCRDRLAFVG